jgi:hypothetical protein
MKKEAIFIFSLLICISCDDKIDSLEKLNTPPYAEYYTVSSNKWIKTENEYTIKEDVKFYNENNKLPYSVSIRFKDKNKNYGTIDLKSEQTSNNFFVNEIEYGQNFKVELDSFSFSHKNEFLSNKKFKIIVKDTWDKTQILNFDLTYFQNALPIPLIQANAINNSEYELNASASYDGDNKIGGFIREFEYVIDNFYVIKTSNNKISHVFSQGSHNIKLRVKDNDNAWSGYVEKNLDIN